MVSTEELKKIFGANGAVLELVQREDGALTLRNAHDEGEKAPLLTIQFNEQIQDLLGENVHVVAQHMIQAAFFSLMEQQMRKYKAEISDEQPEHFS